MSRRRMLRLGAGMLGAAGLAGATLAGAGAAPAAESPGGGNNGEMASLAVEQPIATGQYIANFALQFQGYPYVWAGNTPAGFDCSGFTQYVILNTLGYDIGHGVAGQTGYGAWVDWGAWQPGDLVYFAGTYRAGISHTGVYIGDGLFIHAENEGTGVVVSSIHSGYYAGHYYGAYRHG
jgi:cell wall-associated NlpC family hydrolase